MKSLIIIASIFSLSFSCSATAQLHDMLVIEKDTFFIYTSPLTQKSNLIKRDSNFMKSRIPTTANIRGYVASWELIEDQIYLTKINDVTNGELEADLKTIFDNQEDDNRIKAEWINGEIIVHNKYPMQGYRMGFSSVYEQEYILKIENGKLISAKQFTNIWAKHPLSSDKCRSTCNGFGLFQ